MRRRTLISTGTAFGAAMAGGLARPAIAQTKPGKLLRYVPSADLSSVDPLWSSATVVITHGYMVWDTLYGIDLTLTPRREMVASETVSDGGLTWTFHLRDGLFFHDGTPVRAADCVASLARWQQKDPFGQSIAAVMNEMKPIDDKSFVIRLKKPFPQLLFAIGSRYPFIMPEHIASTPSSTQIKEVIGSGPYRFLAKEWQPGVQAQYERYDRYSPAKGKPELFAGDKTPSFDRVHWITQPDPQTAANALLTNEVDWLEAPLIDLLPELKRNRQVKVQTIDPFGQLALLRFNQLQPPFDNPKLRRALLPAINQVDVVSAVVGDQMDLGKTDIGFFPAASPMANDAGMQALSGKRDLALAKKLVSESGYKGERVVMLAPSDLPAISAMSQVIGDLLKRVGLNIDYQTTDWGTMLARLAKKDPVAQGGWSCYCVTWAGLSVSTPGSSYPLRANGVHASTGWPTDPKLESLRNAWFDTADQAKQKAICREIQTEAFESLPYIPLGEWFNPQAHRTTLSNFVRAPYGLFWGVRMS
jgi:peptide/nickel transport system substrate-binding protein